MSTEIYSQSKEYCIWKTFTSKMEIPFLLVIQWIDIMKRI